jgi:hypothetical protein
MIFHFYKPCDLFRQFPQALLGMVLVCLFTTTMAQPATTSLGLDMSSLQCLTIQTTEPPQTKPTESCESESVVSTEMTPETAPPASASDESCEKPSSVDCARSKKLEVRASEGLPIDEALPDPNASSSGQANGDKHSVQWKQLYWQSFLFMSIEHGFRVATQPDTRTMFQGPFFKDYFNSVKGLRGWGDGDPFLTNYIGHGMMGAVTGFMWLNNDPKSKKSYQEFNREYFKHRLRAMTFSAVYSTQFELGIISEASLGNVGLVPGTKTASTMAFTDLVVTPTVGTLWLIGEDALDRYVVRPLENKTSNRFARLMLRSWLNPSRSFANLLRGKWFWYRDDRKL